MADHYVEFSEVIPHLTEEEAAWLRRQLEPVWVFGDREYDEDTLPDELNRKDADWTGCRVYHSMEDYDSDFGENAGFECAFSDDDKDDEWGRHLWLYCEENGAADRAAHLVQMFLKQFRPKDSWSLTWATTCSKPRVGAFGGGAVFVTASQIKCSDAYEFVEQSTRQANNHAEALLAEGIADSPRGVRRHILYDFDAGNLATTKVYDDYREAADDASRLDNVIVMPLVLAKEADDVAEPQSTQGDSYHLSIDGPIFRLQRELLARLEDRAAENIPNAHDLGDQKLLEGLVALTDELADQAHDNHGVDCLLDETDPPCECELPGIFCSGVPGILARMENGRLAPGVQVERCDLCRRYPTDEAALEKLREIGLVPS